MLGKLFRYDFLSGAKRYLSTLAIVVLYFVLGIFVNLIPSETFGMFYLTIGIMLSIAIILMYIVFSGLFYYNATSSNESVFNYTLPVSTVKMLGSKILAVWSWGVIVVAVLIAFWLGLDKIGMLSLKEAIDSFDKSTFDMIIELSICIITQFMAFSCIFAFSSSLTNTPSMRNKSYRMILAAVIAYGILQTVGIIEICVAGAIFYSKGMSVLSDVDLTPNISILTNTFNVVSITAAAAFFALTVNITKKHKNI